MRKSTIILLVVSLLVLFSGAAVAQDYADEITVYNSGDLEHDPATAMDIKRFEEEYGVKVNVVEVPWQYQIDKLTTVFSSKSDKVDAFVGSYFMLSNFAMPGWLEPIGFTEKEKEKFSPGVMKASTYKGTTYGAPLMMKDTELYYRKDLLEEEGLEVPKDWDELVNAAKKLTKDKDGDGNIDQYGFAYLGADKLGFTFRTFLYQSGGEMFDENLNPVFNSSAGVKALTFMSDLINKYEVTPKGISSMGEGNVGDLFISGKVAMVESVPPLHERIMNSDLSGKASLALAPKGSAGNTTYLDGNVIYVSSFSKKKKTAKAFAKFMSDYESSLHELVEEGNNSPNPSVFDDSRVEEKYPEKWVNVMQESVSDVKAENYPLYLQVEQTLRQEIQKALNGSKTPEKALDDAASQISDLYKNVLGI